MPGLFILKYNHANVSGLLGWQKQTMIRTNSYKMKTHSQWCGLDKIYILINMLLWWFDIMKICLVLSDLFGHKLHVAPKGDGDCLYSDLGLFWDLMASTFDLWPWKSIGFCPNPRCICVPNLVKICQCVCELCIIFHLDKYTNRTKYLPKCKFW